MAILDGDFEFDAMKAYFALQQSLCTECAENVWSGNLNQTSAGVSNPEPLDHTSPRSLKTQHVTPKSNFHQLHPSNKRKFSEYNENGEPLIIDPKELLIQYIFRAGQGHQQSTQAPETHVQPSSTVESDKKESDVSSRSFQKVTPPPDLERVSEATSHGMSSESQNLDQTNPAFSSRIFLDPDATESILDAADIYTSPTEVVDTLSPRSKMVSGITQLPSTINLGKLEPSHTAVTGSSLDPTPGSDKKTSDVSFGSLPDFTPPPDSEQVSEATSHGMSSVSQNLDQQPNPTLASGNLLDSDGTETSDMYPSTTEVLDTISSESILISEGTQLPSTTNVGKLEPSHTAVTGSSPDPTPLSALPSNVQQDPGKSRLPSKANLQLSSAFGYAETLYANPSLSPVGSASMESNTNRQASVQLDTATTRNGQQITVHNTIASLQVDTISPSEESQLMTASAIVASHTPGPAVYSGRTLQSTLTLNLIEIKQSKSGSLYGQLGSMMASDGLLSTRHVASQEATQQSNSVGVMKASIQPTPASVSIPNLNTASSPNQLEYSFNPVRSGNLQAISDVSSETSIPLISNGVLRSTLDSSQIQAEYSKRRISTSVYQMIKTKSVPLPDSNKVELGSMSQLIGAPDLTSAPMLSRSTYATYNTALIQLELTSPTSTWHQSQTMYHSDIFQPQSTSPLMMDQSNASDLQVTNDSTFRARNKSYNITAPDLISRLANQSTLSNFSLHAVSNLTDISRRGPSKDRNAASNGSMQQRHSSTVLPIAYVFVYMSSVLQLSHLINII